jgi:gamma-glutamylcysteine synthetase
MKRPIFFIQKYRCIRNEFGGIEHQIKRWYFPVWVNYIVPYGEEVPMDLRCKNPQKMSWTNLKDYDNWVDLGKPDSKKVIEIIYEIN